jgi:NADPH:quinone reductase-like Zn-dependent oxidoreductase
MVVRVHAAGVNPYDLALMGGYLQSMMEHRFPLVPGIDAAGMVEAVGPGVTRFAVGDAVFGQFLKPYAGEGVFAEAVVVPAEGMVAHKPASIDFAQAAALGTPVLAAYEAIKALASTQGDTVLIVGAAGGVGSYAIQLLARHGVRVLVTGRPGQEGYLHGLGAAEVIDFTSMDVTAAVKARYPEGIDGLIDLVHRTPLELTEQAAVVRSRGHVATTMNAADAEALGRRGIAGTNVMAGSTATPQDLEGIADLVARGGLRVPIAQVFSLEEAPVAFEQLQSGTVQGKVIIEPQR